MNSIRKILVWLLLSLILAIPIAGAAMSPQLAWRDPIYIAAGFAGVLAMAFLLLQPLLAGRYLPGLSVPQARRAHKTIGSLLVVAIVVHLVGLWITSSPDVIDALLFRSPTSFSPWGVVAMWAVFAAALLAVAKRKLRITPRNWRKIHTCFAVIAVVGSVVHAMLIEGTMEFYSKTVLCILVVIATIELIFKLRSREAASTRRAK